MTSFIVSGGLQRKEASKLEEGHRFSHARLLEVDFARKTTDIKLSYAGEPEFYPDSTPNILFTSCTLDGGKLYVCTETEIFVYRYPSMDLLQKSSHPFFQNVHHVSPMQGCIAVASTGLDLVALLDKDTLEPLRLINTEGRETWHRFSPDIDYRKINSTKPHDVHPNFVFENNGQIWVTRFNHKDAVCIDDLSNKIDIKFERVHDGHVIGDYVYFTAVNGCVVIANRQNYKIEEVVDLNLIENIDSALGWCRGLALVDGITYVGFSRLRKTAWRENVKWALGHFGRDTELDTRICAYDLSKKQKVDEYILPYNTSNTIYSIVPC